MKTSHFTNSLIIEVYMMAKVDVGLLAKAGPSVITVSQLM
jgi:hypothetical protein